MVWSEEDMVMVLEWCETYSTDYKRGSGHYVCGLGSVPLPLWSFCKVFGFQRKGKTWL